MINSLLDIISKTENVKKKLFSKKEQKLAIFKNIINDPNKIFILCSISFSDALNISLLKISIRTQIDSNITIKFINSFILSKLKLFNKETIKATKIIIFSIDTDKAAILHNLLNRLLKKYNMNNLIFLYNNEVYTNKNDYSLLSYFTYNPTLNLTNLKALLLVNNLKTKALRLLQLKNTILNRFSLLLKEIKK